MWKDKICGIYMIKNLINGKVYIGSSIHMKDRICRHKYYLKRNLHCNSFLQNTFNKNGINNFHFSIIVECPIEHLVEQENYYINHFNSNNRLFGYNLATVTEGRRNNFNDEVKVGNSKLGLAYYGNFTKFSGLNIITNEKISFDSLVDAANYINMNNYSKGKLRNVRMKISNCLRGVKERNKTPQSAYKHKWSIVE